MARPRKPLRLHLLEGTARKKNHLNRPEVDLPPSSVGRPPIYLKKDALEEWKRLLGNKDYAPVLNLAFRSTLIQYCVLHGRMIEDARGKRKLTGEEQRTLNSLRMQLGLTPASQSKVRAPKKEEAESKWTGFDRTNAG